MGDEVVGEAVPVQEVAVGLRVVGRLLALEEGEREPLVPLDRGQQAQEARVGDPSSLREDAGRAASTGVLEAAPVAVDAHAHLGGMHLDVELGEQAAQQGIGAVVVHDESAVDRMLVDLVGVGVAAEAVVGLEQRDVAVASQDVGGGEAGDARPDDRDRRALM